MRLLGAAILVYFGIVANAKARSGEELVILGVGAGMGAYFWQDADEAAANRGQKTLKWEIGGTERAAHMTLGIYINNDLQLLFRHNQSLVAGEAIISQAQEPGLRYFIWRRIFGEMGAFHALRREKTFSQGRSGWSGRYEYYGTYYGMGTEAQFSYLSIGLVGLKYHSVRDWQTHQGTETGLSEREQILRGAYRGKVEVSVLLGLAI